MPKYFVNARRRIVGQSVVDDPVNPDNYTIVHLSDPIDGDPTLKKIIDDEVIDADPFKDFECDLQQIQYCLLYDRSKVSIKSLNRLKGKSSLYLNLRPIYTNGIGLGTWMDINDNTSKSQIEEICSFCKSTGIIILCHVSGSNKDKERLEDFVFNRLLDGSYLAIYDPDVINPEIASLSRKDQLIQEGIQRHLDDVAQSHGYDTIQSAAMRASIKGPYQSEGVKFAQWMDICWSKYFDILKDVRVGNLLTRQFTLEYCLNRFPVFNLETEK